MESGRGPSWRPLAESMRRYDLATLRHEHALNAGAVFEVTHTFQGSQVITRVKFCETLSSVGPARLWFICPHCRLRCRVLFAGQRLACRRCHRLRYSSQAVSASDRLVRSMFKIIKRIDPDVDVNKIPPRRFGMHNSTYERLLKKHADLTERWLASRRR